MALSLISINIEGDRQLERAVPFLKERPADVVCIQELLKKDITQFEEMLGPCIKYAPMGYTRHKQGEIIGPAIFSRLLAKEAGIAYYVGSPDTMESDKDDDDIGTHPLIYADLVAPDGTYRIVTTHFTWTREGQSTDKQLADLDALFVALEPLGEFALCGDFNAPRGYETHLRLAARYKDNVPPHYKTSIDVRYHRAGDHPGWFADKMVDYLFTTPVYIAKDTDLVFGVSDHAAVVATVTKA